MIRRAFTALGVLGLVLTGTAIPALAQSVPFTDPNTAGYIGLCDPYGHNVTGGSVDATPFVWKSVASSTPPAQYTGQGQNSVLEIFQPRPGIQPADWSGDTMTAATYYHSGSLPVAQATVKDFSLRDYMAEYPPMQDGLYQLRMQFAKQGYATYSARYPATVIQVVGNSWHVVQGGTVNCTAAVGESSEVAIGAAQSAPPAGASSSESSAAGHTSTSGGPTTGDGSSSGRPTSGSASTGDDGTSTTSAPTIGPYAQPLASTRSSTSPGSVGWWVWVIVAAGVVVVAGAALGFLRRRRTTS